MEYFENQRYLEYIQHNVEEIRHFVQLPFHWRHRQEEQVLPIITQAEQEFPEFAHISAMIPDELDRRIVADLFQGQDLYLALVSMLLWGGAHNGPYSSFLRTLAVGRDTLVRKVENVSLLLEEGRLECAFDSMHLGGRNHIDGISTSFFTKIIYFLRFHHQDVPRPLIYDTISAYIHCAILIDQNRVEEYFSWHPRYGLRFLRPEYEMYEDYINSMNSLSQENGIDRSDRLESSLFGWKMSRAFDISNPRAIVKKYVKEYFRERNA